MKAKKVYESIEKFLKPKSTIEVIGEFRKMPLDSQVDFLEQYENKQLIPFEYWPLILQIKQLLKDNKEFDDLFRVTSNDIYSDVQAVKFKIYYRNGGATVTPIEVLQFNNEDILHVYETANTANEEIIDSYDGFMKFLNDDYLGHDMGNSYMFSKPWKPFEIQIKP